MTLLPKDPFGCPYLLLAPMEGVGDRPFRKAMAAIGGFDEACTEFLRVPSNAHVPSLAKKYVANETAPIPQAAQLMGSNPELMAEMTIEIAKRGAPRIDLNCGCPSNTVTGRGAGSSLLKEPNRLYQIAKAMVEVSPVPVTAKLRAGFEDLSLFKENLLAAQESGIKFLTLHPRTKVDGYGPPARWELIAEAKELLKIPVVGNGDILNADDALRMLKMTRCDALMVGRGSVITPWIFHSIRSAFSGIPYIHDIQSIEKFFAVFIADMPPETPPRTRLNKVKQLVSFLFRRNEALQSKRQEMLSMVCEDADQYVARVLAVMRE